MKILNYGDKNTFNYLLTGVRNGILYRWDFDEIDRHKIIYFFDSRKSIWICFSGDDEFTNWIRTDLIERMLCK